MDINNKQKEHNSSDKFKNQIEKMRLATTDSERCREIARKLVAYISSSK